MKVSTWLAFGMVVLTSFLGGKLLLTHGAKPTVVQSAPMAVVRLAPATVVQPAPAAVVQPAPVDTTALDKVTSMITAVQKSWTSVAPFLTTPPVNPGRQFVPKHPNSAACRPDGNNLARPPVELPKPVTFTVRNGTNGRINFTSCDQSLVLDPYQSGSITCMSWPLGFTCYYWYPHGHWHPVGRRSGATVIVGPSPCMDPITAVITPKNGKTLAFVPTGSGWTWREE